MRYVGKASRWILPTRIRGAIALLAGHTVMYRCDVYGTGTSPVLRVSRPSFIADSRFTIEA